METPTATNALAIGDKVNMDDRMYAVTALTREADGFVVTLRDEDTHEEHEIDMDPSDEDTPVWLVTKD